MKQKQKPIECSKCKHSFHAYSCTITTRYQMEKKILKQNQKWTCHICSGKKLPKKKTAQEKKEAAAESPKKCETCKVNIKRGIDSLTCPGCNKFFHKQKECSNTSRDILKGNRERWKCRGCRVVNTNTQTARLPMIPEANTHSEQETIQLDEETVQLQQDSTQPQCPAAAHSRNAQPQRPATAHSRSAQPQRPAATHSRNTQPLTAQLEEETVQPERENDMEANVT